MASYTKNTPGKPTSGFYAVGDTVTDSVGIVWQCVAAGLPGSWLGVPGGSSVGEPRTTSGVGTKNSSSTVAVAEYGVGTIHKTVFTCTATPISFADDAGVAQYGGVKLYDFPAGHIVTIGAVINGSLTLPAPFIDAFTGVVAMGSATAGTGSTLTSTESDILQSTALTTAVSKVANCDAYSIATALTEAGARWFNDASDLDLFLNYAIADNAAHTAETGTFTGTVTVVWVNLGNS